MPFLVCGHLRLTPQSVNIFGGYKVQGRGDEQAINRSAMH
ncbi:3-methyl-2-oxobutanoate hydroxymethyltransferase [Escherichia coli]